MAPWPLVLAAAPLFAFVARSGERLLVTDGTFLAVDEVYEAGWNVVKDEVAVIP